MTRRKMTKGFSLIEVLFASFVALICALVFAASMPIADKSRQKADQYSIALGLAQKELEAIRSVDSALSIDQVYAAGLIDSTTPVATDTYSFTNVDSASFDNPAKVLPSGTGQVKIELVDLELHRVTVEVRWKENGEDRSATVGTLIAQLN